MMSNDILLNTANKYLINDLKDAAIPGGRFAIILEKLETNEKISDELLDFLNQGCFVALYLLATEEITFADYLPLAQEEQVERQEAVGKEARRIRFLAEAEEAEQERRNFVRRRHEQYEAEQRARLEEHWARLEERRARLADPRYQAKIRERELRQQYGLEAFIDPKNYPRLLGLLRMLENGSRISAEEFIWLSTQGDDTYDRYLTIELAERYHLVEARYLAAEFRRTGDLWQAVNASGHFRKCEEPQQAIQLLGRTEISLVKNAKLQSALCTTLGGAHRDLSAFDTALELGSRAHKLTPHDFRPCTLLGAVHYEQSNYEQGQRWYEMAVERGFKESQVDSELKSIFRQLSPDKRAAMREHLLSLDQDRYEWAKE
ncbi:hypothetical protein JWG42_11930 [Desulfoprunum benzoelyticum]|uniref:TPR repeat protein n=1 Tax=Desulfoprunum benzoelyticum TaxID=1506996 RepID=A0A840V625_9BACT|nr:hypothetical protein [Desulfoprunum benzoelyticum]MBB5349209.1 TPR repeat protein [Desulfoprunum benzoelyticum]MBM9530860.1 hypothetical protein [Desulfoprunum benzoelyticum]